jgi:hypothetical protein
MGVFKGASTSAGICAWTIAEPGHVLLNTIENEKK